MGLFEDDGMTLIKAIKWIYLSHQDSEIYVNIPEDLKNYFTSTFSQKVKRYKSSGFTIINTAKKLEQLFSIIDDLAILHTLEWLIGNNYLEVLQNKKKSLLDSADTSEFEKELSGFCEMKWSEFFSSFKKSIPINIIKAINTADLEKQSIAKQIIFFDSSDNEAVKLTQTLVAKAIKLSENLEPISANEFNTRTTYNKGLIKKLAVSVWKALLDAGKSFDSVLLEKVEKIYIDNYQDSSIFKNLPNPLKNISIQRLEEAIYNYETSKNRSKKKQNIVVVIDLIACIHLLSWLVSNNYLQVLIRKKRTLIYKDDYGDFVYEKYYKEFTSFCEKKYSDFAQNFKQSLINQNLFYTLRDVDIQNNSALKRVLFTTEDDFEAFYALLELVLSLVEESSLELDNEELDTITESYEFEEVKDKSHTKVIDMIGEGRNIGKKVGTGWYKEAESNELSSTDNKPWSFTTWFWMSIILVGILINAVDEGNTKQNTTTKHSIAPANQSGDGFIKKDGLFCLSKVQFDRQIDILARGQTTLAPGCYIVPNNQSVWLVNSRWNGEYIVERISDGRKLYILGEDYQGH